MPKSYYVYIITNSHNTTLYTGITSKLYQRIHQHRLGLGGIFSSKYRLSKLVYYEEYQDPQIAITREKQIKAGTRNKKIELIESINPDWSDLIQGD